jgi:hypothetical protein
MFSLYLYMLFKVVGPICVSIELALIIFVLAVVVEADGGLHPAGRTQAAVGLLPLVQQKGLGKATPAGKTLLLEGMGVSLIFLFRVFLRQYNICG